MAVDLRIGGIPIGERPVRPVRVAQEPQVEQLLRWASFLDAGGGASATGRVRAAQALGEAADGDAELMHQAWLLGLRRLRGGDATRSSVELMRRALDVMHSEAQV
jgi:hypothetical protein